MSKEFLSTYKEVVKGCFIFVGIGIVLLLSLAGPLILAAVLHSNYTGNAFSNTSTSILYSVLIWVGVVLTYIFVSIPILSWMIKNHTRRV